MFDNKQPDPQLENYQPVVEISGKPLKPPTGGSGVPEPYGSPTLATFGDPGRSLTAEIVQLKETVNVMVELQRALLKKLEEQSVSLGAIARFVHDQGNYTPGFGVGR